VRVAKHGGDTMPEDWDHPGAISWRDDAGAAQEARQDVQDRQVKDAQVSVTMNKCAGSAQRREQECRVRSEEGTGHLPQTIPHPQSTRARGLPT